MLRPCGSIRRAATYLLRRHGCISEAIRRIETQRTVATLLRAHSGQKSIPSGSDCTITNCASTVGIPQAARPGILRRRSLDSAGSGTEDFARRIDDQPYAGGI